MPKRRYARDTAGKFAHIPGGKATSSRKAPGLSSRKIARVNTQGRLGKAQKTISEPAGNHRLTPTAPKVHTGPAASPAKLTPGGSGPSLAEVMNNPHAYPSKSAHTDAIIAAKKRERLAAGGPVIPKGHLLHKGKVIKASDINKVPYKKL